MKNIGILAALALVVITSFTCCKKNKDLVTQIPLPEGYYEDDWEGAMKAANDHDRKIFVQFYADWCQLCATFKEDVMGDNEVQTYMNEKFVTVLMDSENGKGKERFEHYGLQNHPNVIVIDKDGNLEGQRNGLMSKEVFLTWIKPYE